MQEVLAGRSLIRAVAYVITTETGEERGFFDALEKLGIETKTKNIQIFNSGAKKADWDVGLAVDAIKMAPKLDTIIIASGDGDFIPLVEYLQTNEGCQVEVIAFGKSSSSKLREVADDFIDMCQDPKKYTIGGSHNDSRENRDSSRSSRNSQNLRENIRDAGKSNDAPEKYSNTDQGNKNDNVQLKKNQTSNKRKVGKNTRNSRAVSKKQNNNEDDGFVTSEDLAKIFGKN